MLVACLLLLLPACLLLQVYDILNSLEDRLGVTNSAVVLAAMKVRQREASAVSRLMASNENANVP